MGKPAFDLAKPEVFPERAAALFGRNLACRARVTSRLNIRRRCQRLPVFRAGVFALASDETIASLQRSLGGIPSLLACDRLLRNGALKSYSSSAVIGRIPY